MSTRRNLQTNFAAGELTPRMVARADTSAYQNGVAKLRDYRQLIQGGVKRRPGLRYIDTLGPDAEARLFEFAFNAGQTYVMITRPGLMDVYDRDGNFATQLTGCPWDTTEKVRTLRTAQNGDTMVVCGASFRPQRIIRTGASSFTRDDWTFETDQQTLEVWQPYFKHVDAAVTLETDKPSGNGAILTVSASVFTAQHVGAVVRHKGRQIAITQVNSGTEAVGNIRRQLRADDDINKDLIEDGDFKKDEFWSIDDNWTIAGGTATPVTVKRSMLRQEVLPTQGDSHDLVITTANHTAGNVKVSFDSQTITTVSTGGSTTTTFTPNKGEGFLILAASADFDGEVTKVSLQKGGTAPELVNETDLSGTRYWLVSGAWVVANNKAYIEGSATYDLSQKVLPQLQEEYILEIEVSGRSAGTLDVRLGNEVLTTINANGTQTYEFRAETGEAELKLQADAAWDGAIKRVSLTRKPDNGPTVDWDEPAYSSYRGWPAVPYFHSQRMIFAGGAVPNGIFMSKPGAYYNFDDGDGEDDDGIAYSIAQNRIAEIRAITALRHLQVFTSEGELYIPIGEARPLTPANIMFQKQTPLGVTRYVEPREFDGAVLFIPRSEATVREFVYSDIQQAYSSDAVSLLAQHLIDDPRDMDVALESQGQPEQYAYIVNQNGTMPVFLSNRAEKVTGWAMWTTEGTFRSVANISDRVYVVVGRNIGGQGTRLYLEYFDESLNLDCATSIISGSETDTWQVSWLESHEIEVTSGNYYLGNPTTDSSGTFSVGYLATTIQAGLGFVPELQTLPPEIQLEDGPTVGERRRVVKASVVLDDTLNLQVTHQQRPGEFSIRQVSDDLSAQPVAITGRQDFSLLGWDDHGTVTIRQTVPLPCTILGLNTELEY